MRISLNETEKPRSCSCDCLHNNIIVESLVVVFTLVSGLAITGESLVSFDMITVPNYAKAAPNLTSNNHTEDMARTAVITENTFAKNILTKVFHYISLGIAGLFLVEICLKVFTLQKKFVASPWQIFDTVVVLASLALELVFHFVCFGERVLSLLTYIVLLRLWRVPMLCIIRDNQVQDVSDCDAELYRSGSLKLEERCRMLENTISQQIETIIKLEKLLHSLTGSNQRDPAFGDENTNKARDLLRKTHDLQTSVDVPHNGIIKESTRTCENEISSSNNNTFTVESAKRNSDCPQRVVKATTELKTLPWAQTSYPLLPSSSHQSQISMRPRKRRSSASEILDYISLSAPDMISVFYDRAEKSPACQSESLEYDKLLTDNIQEKEFGDRNNIAEKGVPTSADSLSELISMTPDDEKNLQDMKRTRRLVSCPECVYTQRMSITNDESLLIEDGHTTEDPVVYNNIGFEFGENVLLHVMAEYDGTKTYLNEDGVPMTSL